MIRLYTTFQNLSGQNHPIRLQDGFSVGPLPTLFRDVLNEPRIGHYIREVELGLLHDMKFHYSKSGEPTAVYKQQFGLVDAAIARSDVPEVRAKHEKLKAEGYKFNCGGEDLLISLLLPLLPNLNSMSMEWDAGPDSCLLSTIRHSALVGFPWLANLTTVLLEERRYFARRKVCLSDLRSFSLLPALKSLTAFEICDDPGSLDTTDENLHHQDSHTTQLNLASYHGSSRLLHGYLKSFQSLQNFSFQYSPSRDPINDGDFDPFWIRKALLTCAKTTLRTLKLLGPTASDQFMGSLQAFEALRDIHTEFRFLFPKHSDLETQPSRILPASLHRLRLHDQSDCIGDEYRAFFRGIQHAKHAICLHLEDVVVETKAAKYALRQSWSARG